MYPTGSLLGISYLRNRTVMNKLEKYIDTKALAQFSNESLMSAGSILDITNRLLSETPEEKVFNAAFRLLFACKDENSQTDKDNYLRKIKDDINYISFNAFEFIWDTDSGNKAFLNQTYRHF